MAVQPQSHRLSRANAPSLRNWEPVAEPAARQMRENAVVDMGWGRLIFGQTFRANQKIVDDLCGEQKGQRDIAFYLRDPHVVLSLAPHRLFLDPSHTYRIWRHDYRAGDRPLAGYRIRRIESIEDAREINRIYASRQMVTPPPEFLLDERASMLRTYFIAEEEESERVVGTVTGVDHVHAFDDPEQGASLWCLAVDPQCHLPGVGESLVRHLVEHYLARGRQYVDLSVMHDNEQAIALYKKLGFHRVPVFCVKHKNPINEPLFVAPEPMEQQLNPYATIIVNEARRRGIFVEVLDPEMGYFKLTMGGRSITCRESLTELTSAIAMSRCDDKRVTRRVLEGAGLSVPAQQRAAGNDENLAFLEQHGRIVVKPARGEQGVGISVDVRTPEDMKAAIEAARQFASDVLLEQFVEGQDLRVVVIDHKVVAAAVRRPPVVVGTGRHTLRAVIEKYNRRRQAATGGESAVPLDVETERCVQSEGYGLDDTPPAGQSIRVRKTANLHTGGTIHDVTAELHPALAEASVAATRAMEVPVAGLDLLVPDVAGPEHVIIEVNERVGLANHEPQPTAERFIDFLFPASATRA